MGVKLKARFPRCANHPALPTTTTHKMTETLSINNINIKSRDRYWLDSLTEDCSEMSSEWLLQSFRKVLDKNPEFALKPRWTPLFTDISDTKDFIKCLLADSGTGPEPEEADDWFENVFKEIDDNLLWSDLMDSFNEIHWGVCGGDSEDNWMETSLELLRESKSALENRVEDLRQKVADERKLLEQMIRERDSKLETLENILLGEDDTSDDEATCCEKCWEPVPENKIVRSSDESPFCPECWNHTVRHRHGESGNSV